MLPIIVAFVVVCVAGAGGYFFFMKKNDDINNHQKDAKMVKIESGIHQFHDMVLNLDEQSDSGSKFLKIRFALELQDIRDAKLIERDDAKITDALNIYLRGLRSSDVIDRRSIVAIKHGIAKHINDVIGKDNVVQSVFIQELLVS